VPASSWLGIYSTFWSLKCIQITFNRSANVSYVEKVVIQQSLFSIKPFDLLVAQNPEAGIQGIQFGNLDICAIEIIGILTGLSQAEMANVVTTNRLDILVELSGTGSGIAPIVDLPQYFNRFASCVGESYARVNTKG
jgi:hypothetical protein